MTDRRTEVDGQPSSPGETLRYADMVEIGTWFGHDHRVVSTWRKRYAADHPFPEPDVMVGRTPGWARSRRPEIEIWERGRPGRGAGGGRPRKRDLS
ncbi:hypothetical protein AB0F91_21560 [Amycolatopsis sp. NPDC023774]|uniref:hypothetical protein n=1 Tax=Amycolatopsis sp. NPDC023774 TaxID=3155015 RepID=UPI0033F0FF06